MSIAASIFGPEYIDAIVEDFGIFEASGSMAPKLVDICDTIRPGSISPLLPPGGYIVKYISGAFLTMDGEPTVFVVGGNRGMRIEWKSSIGHSWTSVGYPIELEAVSAEVFKSIDMANLENFFYLEFTMPHRLRLVPPTDSVGRVRMRVLRYIPSVLLSRREPQDVILS